MLEKLRHNVALTANAFFVDATERDGIAHFNLTLMALAYLMGRNVLLTGEPGFGKTSAAKTVLAVFSGLPYDLYEACQIEGHPEQTRETLVGRPDFHKLATEGEVTIWNLSVYLPGLLVDELNRLPEGKQDVLLTCVDTGRFNSPLGHTVYTGKRPFFATANYRDEGELLLTPAMLDRFDISLELGSPGPFYREAIANANAAREQISSPLRVDRLLDQLQDRSLDETGRFAAITVCREAFAEQMAAAGIQPLTPADVQAWQQTMASMPFSHEALLLLDCLESEMNFSPLYGFKRRNDPVDGSTHAQQLASSKVSNSLSPRASLAIQQFARAVALMQGAAEVDKRHLSLVVPHVLGHRLEPTDDFRARYAERVRETRGPENVELAHQLLLDVEDNFRGVYESLALLDNYRRGTLGAAQRSEAEALLSSPPERIDHPLLRDFVSRLVRRHGSETAS